MASFSGRVSVDVAVGVAFGSVVGVGVGVHALKMQRILRITELVAGVCVAVAVAVGVAGQGFRLQ